MGVVRLALTAAKTVCGAAVNFMSGFLTGTTETAEAITYDLFKPIIDSFTSQINPGTIIAILAGVIAAGIGLVFMWWGLRKLVDVLMTAFKKGKLKF